jgi:hypothetical protein
MISFLFWFVAVVLGNPETPTVSHSFPKVCGALQKNCGIEIGNRYQPGFEGAAVPAPGR